MTSQSLTRPRELSCAQEPKSSPILKEIDVGRSDERLCSPWDFNLDETFVDRLEVHSLVLRNALGRKNQ